VLSTDAGRYVELRQRFGHRLAEAARYLRAFARFAEARGDTHVRAERAMEWATEASTPRMRGLRLRTVEHLARFLRAEDPKHEVPPRGCFPTEFARLPPYIYEPAEIVQLLAAARRLSRTYPLRRETYATLLGLLASTGLRISEALELTFRDVEPGGVLVVRNGKRGKSRRVPLHPTTAAALSRYIERRNRIPVRDQHLFLSAGGKRISRSMTDYTFRTIARLAGVGGDRARPCRMHDLRHTFATRSLEACATERMAVGEHFVALSTYLGHADIKHTYWYLEATPQLMGGMARAAEALFARAE
jgi:integrase